MTCPRRTGAGQVCCHTVASRVDHRPSQRPPSDHGKAEARTTAGGALLDFLSHLAVTHPAPHPGPRKYGPGGRSQSAESPQEVRKPPTLANARSDVCAGQRPTANITNAARSCERSSRCISTSSGTGPGPTEPVDGQPPAPTPKARTSGSPPASSRTPPRCSPQSSTKQLGVTPSGAAAGSPPSTAAPPDRDDQRPRCHRGRRPLAQR